MGAPQAAAVGLVQHDSSHRIMPPRFFVPLDAPQTALPYQGMAEQDVYFCRRLSGATLVERYVEWVHADAAAGTGAGPGASSSRQ